MNSDILETVLHRTDRKMKTRKRTVACFCHNTTVIQSLFKDIWQTLSFATKKKNNLKYTTSQCCYNTKHQASVWKTARQVRDFSSGKIFNNVKIHGRCQCFKSYKVALTYRILEADMMLKSIVIFRCCLIRFPRKLS